MPLTEGEQHSAVPISRTILFIAGLSSLGFWLSIHYGNSPTDFVKHHWPSVVKWLLLIVLLFVIATAATPKLWASLKTHFSHHFGTFQQWSGGLFIILASYGAMNLLPPGCPKIPAGVVIAIIAGFFGALVGNYFPFLKASSAKNTLPSDKLHRSHFVSCFTDLLSRNFDNEEPELRRIALTGPWGIGKTDFIERVRIELTKRNDMIKTSTVNPWRAKNKSEAHQCLIEGIDLALDIWRPKKGISITLFRVFTKIWGGKSPSFKVLEALKELDPTKSRSRLHEVNAWLKKERRKVIVFVDDMERTDLNTIRAILPILDQLEELNRCVFVFAIDQNRIENSLKDKDEAHGFLRKVFDSQMEIPSPTQRELAKFARETVSQTESPLLYSSLQKFDTYLPTSPRELKQWLNKCQLEEKMFFHNVWNEKQKKFSAFFFHRLIDYEFPGFSEYLVSDFGQKSLNKENLEIYHSRMSQLMGTEKSQKPESQKTLSETESLIEGFFKRKKIIKKERLIRLFSRYKELLKDGEIQGDYSIEWACREYKLVTGFHLADRAQVLQRFQESPTTHLKEIISSVFNENKKDHVNLFAVERDFFTNFILEGIHEPLRYSNSNPKNKEEVKGNLEKLIQQIKSLNPTSAPEYITDGISKSILESHGMLINIADNTITDLFLELDKHWAQLSNFHWVASLLARIQREPQPFDLGIHCDGNHIWLSKLNFTLKKRLTQDLSEISKSHTVSDDFEALTGMNIANFFINPEMFFDKEELSKCLQKETYSQNFIVECMYGIFGADVEDGNKTGFFSRKQQNAGAFSFLAQPHAPTVSSELIERYQTKIVKIYSQIHSKDIREWFKNDFIGPQISNHLRANFDEVDSAPEKQP